MYRSRLHGYLLLLVVVAFSSSNGPEQQIPSSYSSRSRRSSFILADSAQPIEQIPLTPQTLVDGVIIKNSSSAADRVAPAAVVRRYRPPGMGRGGRWDNFDYGDARNQYPSRYCPSQCRAVSSRICGCQCVTRDSLNWYYMMRRRGQWVYPTCCYLKTPVNGGGGWGSSSGSWGGSSGVWGSTSGGGGSSSGTTSGSSSGTSGSGGGGEPTAQQTVSLNTFAVGQCTAGGMAVIEVGVKGFIATMPGVTGSTVQVSGICFLSPSVLFITGGGGHARKFLGQPQRLVVGRGVGDT